MSVAETPAPILFGYLIGAMPVSWLVVRVLAGHDLRIVGSGNVGATNALRVTSWPVAVLVAVLDATKGAGAVLVGRTLATGDMAPALAGIAAVVGHVFPCWLAFRGGKGIATAAGAFALLAPAATVTATIVFAAAAAVGRMVSLASVAAVVVLMVTAWTLSSRTISVAATVVGVLIVWRHRENLHRLRVGREPRIGQHSPSGRTE